MEAASALASHTTNGAMLSGSLASNWSGFGSAGPSPKPRFSVIRVNAAGAMALTVTP